MGELLIEALCNAINCNSAENGSNTPDYILAEFLASVLTAFNDATRKRDAWYGVTLAPGMSRTHPPAADNVDRDMLLAAIDRLPEADPCDEMLGLSEKNGWGTRDADDRAWVLSRFREWDSAASLFPASDRPIAIRLAIRLLTLKEDAVEQPWNDVDRTLPPSGVFVETMRTGERLPNVCAWQWARLGTDIEWYERGKPGDPGRTTVTHSTFIPPTHWRPIRTGSAS